MSTPENAPPVRYPDSWRPKGAPPFPEPEPEPEIQPLAAEIWLASLDADEFDRIVKRAKGNR